MYTKFILKVIFYHIYSTLCVIRDLHWQLRPCPRLIRAGVGSIKNFFFFWFGLQLLFWPGWAWVENCCRPWAHLYFISLYRTTKVIETIIYSFFSKWHWDLLRPKSDDFFWAVMGLILFFWSGAAELDLKLFFFAPGQAWFEIFFRWGLEGLNQAWAEKSTICRSLAQILNKINHRNNNLCLFFF